MADCITAAPKNSAASVLTCSRGRTQRRTAQRLTSTKPISQTFRTIANAHSGSANRKSIRLTTSHDTLRRGTRQCKQAAQLRDARAAVSPAFQLFLKLGQARAGGNGGANLRLGHFEAGTDRTVIHARTGVGG